jgi:CBS domain-containing protein
MSLAEAMVTKVSTCRPGDSLLKAAGLMWDLDVECLAVVDDDGDPVAMLTDQDISRSSHLWRGRPLSAVFVREVLSRSPAGLRTSMLRLIVGDPALLPVIDSNGGPLPRPRGAMSGLLKDFPIPDLLQLFLASKKSGVLAVSTPDHQGRIYLRDGQIYYAAIDGDPAPGPRKSFCRIVGWDDGTFELEPPDGTEFSNPIDEGTEALLMETLCQLDEQRELAKELPPASANLAAPDSPAMPLQELSPAQLGVLQLALSHHCVRHVFDKSQLTDRDTCEALVHLMKHGYLSVH